MIEIAIALAVLAFALVAIIGILPAGLQVQQESRERTVINAEAVYFLDAIKSGARDMSDLPDFLDTLYNGTTTNFYVITSGVTNLLSLNTPGGDFIGWLSRPGTNLLVLRPINSSAVDRGERGLDLAMRYRLSVEVHGPEDPALWPLASNRWDLRLEFRWPVLPGEVLGRGRSVYRSAITAPLWLDPDNTDLVYFRP